MAWVVDAILVRAFAIETWPCSVTLNGVISFGQTALGCDTFAFLIQSQLRVKHSNTYLLRHTRQASGTRRLFFTGGRDSSESFSDSKSVFIDLSSGQQEGTDSDEEGKSEECISLRDTSVHKRPFRFCPV